MRIVTPSGKAFEANWVLATKDRHGTAQLVLQLPGTVDIGDVVHGLVGASTITEQKEDGVYTAYEGFTQMHSIYFTHDRSALRLTLEKVG